MTLIKPQCILFDLDGTLIDSAPDLAYAMNCVREEFGLPMMDEALLRPYASKGAPGLTDCAFHIPVQSPLFPTIKERFLTHYRQNLTAKTSLFPGISELLIQLEKRNIAWGIVTNKVTQLTLPIVSAIGLSKAHCIVCGDTTSHPKPAPDPLLFAVNQLNIKPSDTWYIGDDERDIIAGHAANMKTFAASWGYGENIASWNADYIVPSAQFLIDVISSF